jgi:hypothetical protein
MSFEKALNNEKPNFFNIDDLEKMRSDMDKEADQIELRYAAKEISREEYIRLIKKLHQNTADKLIANKEKFAHIFQTEMGSYYFVLQSGHCFRIKSTEKSLLTQPIMDNVFFMGMSESDLLLDEMAKKGPTILLDRLLDVTELKKGVCPVETGMHNIGSSPSITRFDHAIKIMGSISKDGKIIDKQIYGGVHFGNAISEIIK